ncbi:hypothetical protein TrRE_jg12132 [Triparma retinervis]|uniref:Uncharacterized protein n=1 Tax=Triparma retinervis TaxID=2557542 RepID=A0A9W6ZPZ3_9STRA|nr:hypothetical protein TrRE_jg12132 [Triparma retinervis]
MLLSWDDWRNGDSAIFLLVDFVLLPRGFGAVLGLDEALELGRRVGACVEAGGNVVAAAVPVPDVGEDVAGPGGAPDGGGTTSDGVAMKKGDLPHGESLINVTREEHEALKALSRYVPVGVVERGLVGIAHEEEGGGEGAEGVEARRGGERLQSPRKRGALLTLEGEEDMPQFTGGGGERAPQFEIVPSSPQSDGEGEGEGEKGVEEERERGIMNREELLRGYSDSSADVLMGMEQQSVISKNLEICDSLWSPAESRKVESWPSRLLRLLANDLLNSSIRSTNKVRRKSQLLRAMDKVKFVNNVSNAAQRKKMDNGALQRSKIAARKELGHLKYLSSKGNEGVVGKTKKPVTLNLGAIGDR